MNHFRNTGTKSVQELSSATKNIVISPLESIHINITNLTAFVDHIEKHLPTYDKHDDEVRKDFIKAIRNIVAFSRLLPDLLVSDMSSMLSDPKKMLDIGSIQAANILEDIKIIYYFTVTVIDSIGKQNEADKVLLVLPLVRFIFTKEGDPDSMERIAKRFVEHAPVFLNRHRDHLIKSGQYKGDSSNPYKSTTSQDSRSQDNNYSGDSRTGSIDINSLLTNTDDD